MKGAVLLHAGILMLILVVPIAAEERESFQDRADTFRTPVVSLSLDGGYSQPLYADLGGGPVLRLGGNFRLPRLPRFVGRAELGFGLLSVPMAVEMPPVRIGVARVSAGAGITLGSLTGLAFTPFLGGGVYTAKVIDLQESYLGWGGRIVQSNFLLEAGVASQYRFSSHWAATADLRVGFLRALASVNPSVGMGIRWVPVFAQPDEPVQLHKLSFARLFPSLFRAYARIPVGSFEIVNAGERIADDIRITFFVDRFMQEPQVCSSPSLLAAGERYAVDIRPLLSPDVLEITEGLEVQGTLSIDYTIRGKQMRTEQVVTVSFHDRNAIQWDDDEKAAVFVTARDHTVLAFARNAVSVAGATTSPMINRGLTQAITLFSALGEHNITYMPDPTTPYSEFSEDAKSVDFLQFPRQTLSYRAGDCDDISVLYAALLESVGVSAALITVPGHIYTAIDLQVSPDDARQVFSSIDDLIFAEGTTWLPLEATLLHDTFDYAWHVGAQQWREHSAAGEARLYPIHGAWEKYEPVGISGDLVELPSLPDESLADRVALELNRIVQREIQDARDRLLVQLERSPGDPALLNRLGVLYARFGLDVDAEEQFKSAIDTNQHVPAVINLATIYLARGEPEHALELYSDVHQQDPNNAMAVLGITRAYHSMASFSEAREWHARLARLAPQLARDFEFLTSSSGTAGRAGQAAAVEGEFVWVE